jgi:hypothetical protein
VGHAHTVLLPGLTELQSPMPAAQLQTLQLGVRKLVAALHC